MIWVSVLAASLGCYLLKLAGYLFPQRWLEGPGLRRLTTLLPVAMLSALIAVQTFSVGTSLQVDARLAGLGAAVIALVLRAPFLVVVVVAAATAAGLRAAGWAN